MAKIIQLTQGQVALVCDCHAHLVENYKWCARWSEDTKSFYADAAHAYDTAAHELHGEFAWTNFEN